MRVINVVVIKNGAVYDIESFGVFEEQLSQDVVDEAEKAFRRKAVEMMESDGNFKGDFSQISEEQFDAMVENGIYEHSATDSVCLTWSDI